jgi:hypothetical protein
MIKRIQTTPKRFIGFQGVVLGVFTEIDVIC